MDIGSPILLATRRSPLALAQARQTRDRVKALWPGHIVELVEMTTTGDQKRDWVLSQTGGKGLFTKELEECLLAGHASLAVHSAKDLPTDLPAGLSIAAFLPREDPRDVLVFRRQCPLDDSGRPVLNNIASGSPRRRAQLAKSYPNAKWSELRGNVETRLRKIASGEADATLLAAAGLNRLNIMAYEDLVFYPLPIEQSVPAPGQAAIALECRSADVPLFAKLADIPTTLSVETERKLLSLLGGGCHSAVAVHSTGNRLLVFTESGGFLETELSGQSLEERIPELERLSRKLAS